MALAAAEAAFPFWVDEVAATAADEGHPLLSVHAAEAHWGTRREAHREWDVRARSRSGHEFAQRIAISRIAFDTQPARDRDELIRRHIASAVRVLCRVHGCLGVRERREALDAARSALDDPEALQRAYEAVVDAGDFPILDGSLEADAWWSAATALLCDVMPGVDHGPPLDASLIDSVMRQLGIAHEVAGGLPGQTLLVGREVADAAREAVREENEQAARTGGTPVRVVTDPFVPPDTILMLDPARMPPLRVDRTLLGVMQAAANGPPSRRRPLDLGEVEEWVRAALRESVAIAGSDVVQHGIVNALRDAITGSVRQPR